MKPVVTRELLTTILREATPVDLRIVGRTLLHAALVGLAAGLIGAAFFAALEIVQRLSPREPAGYRVLRASGETFVRALDAGRPFRWWLLLFLPAVGALGGGLISRSRPRRAAAAATR